MSKNSKRKIYQFPLFTVASFISGSSLSTSVHFPRIKFLYQMWCQSHVSFRVLCCFHDCDTSLCPLAGVKHRWLNNGCHFPKLLVVSLHEHCSKGKFMCLSSFVPFFSYLATLRTVSVRFLTFFCYLNLFWLFT